MQPSPMESPSHPSLAATPGTHLPADSQAFSELVSELLYAGEGSDSTGVPTKMLTVNGSLKISVYNPATLLAFMLAPPLSIWSIWRSLLQLVSQEKPPDGVGELRGNNVPLFGVGSSLSVNSQTGGEVPLKFGIKSKGEVGEDK
ncbi:hypothetical protein Ddye_014679 [Dipteronia dyeriana]|uniref:Uncharacterized protein n=1 Tax=Dipteronia dyeriana TaxID=168575 RepID=A0AAE0CLD3_9ROSI|nr:hypothetical protein Ddye_014679 [Dipteronia dyeriana]